MSKIGLGSLLSKIVTILVLGVLVYLVYFPNFLSIKNVKISGAADIEALNRTNDFLKTASPFPQKNLLMLSGSKLKNYLLQNDSKILSVNSVKKKFPNTLLIDVSPRVDEFIIRDGQNTYLASNDGIITSQYIQTASSTLPSNLVLIKLLSTPDLSVGQNAVPKNSIAFLEGLNKQLPETARSPISYYETDNFGATDVTAYAANFKIKFDFNTDLTSVLSSLKTLMGQLSDADLKKLSYIDMRYEGKAYTCNKDAPCVNAYPSSGSTSTPDNLKN